MPQPDPPDDTVAQHAGNLPVGHTPDGIPPRPPGPGNTAEFADFYRGHLKRLIQYLVYQGSSAHLAAEFAQEAMIAVYQRWKQVEHPRAYAYATAYRRYLRHIMTVSETPVDDVPEQSGILPQPDATERWLQEQEIVSVLRSLPPRQRQVLSLHLDGWSNPEIASLLTIDESAAGSNLHKARRAAAEALSRLGKENP